MRNEDERGMRNTSGRRPAGGNKTNRSPRYREEELYEPRPRRSNQQNGSMRRSGQPGSTMKRTRVTKQQRKKEFLKGFIPVLIAIILIVVVAVVALTSGMLDSLKYSSERADLYSYFNISDNDYAVAIVDNQVSDNKIHIINNKPYYDLEEVNDRYNGRFYYDTESNSYLYTKANTIDRASVGENAYYLNDVQTTVDFAPYVEENEVVYMALDYLKLYENLTYKLCGGNGEPYRIEIKKEWGTDTKVPVVKEQAVRVDANKKSEILKEMSEGDVLTVVEAGDEWTKVKTDDLLIGYIESKFLGSTYDEAETPATSAEPFVIPSNNNGEPVILAWNNVVGSAANEGISNWLAGARGINVISPTWFTVTDDNGTIATIGSKSYVDTCHAAGVKVWGVFDNLQHLEVSSFEIFSKASKRSSMISQLMTYVDEYGLDGINMDVESIPTESGEHYVQFLRELSIACRNKGIILSVDNYVPKGYNDHYNRAEQGVYADYVIIMGYDEHYAGSDEAGSVASLDYVKDGIENTVNVVPANKVINAVPLYTRLWIETEKTAEQLEADSVIFNDDGSETKVELEDIIPYTLEVQTLPMGDGIATAKASGAQIMWDEVTGQNYATWNKGGKTYEIWLEDEDSLKAKLNVMQNYGVAGVAAWQIAYAEDYVWDLFTSYY